MGPTLSPAPARRVTTIARVGTELRALRGRARPGCALTGRTQAPARALSPGNPLPSAGRILARLHPRHQPVQELPVPDHPELLARGALLRDGVALERARESGERVQHDFELADRPPLFSDVTPQRQPVERTVLPGLKREGREDHGGDEAGEAGARHRPYRSRPGK